MLTGLRILNIFIWSVLLFHMVPAVRNVIMGKDVHRDDPMRMSIAAVCVVIILSNFRWLLAPQNDALFLAVYILTALVGIYKICLARVYGRGPKL